MGAWVAASRCSQEPVNHNVCRNSKIFVAHTVLLNFFIIHFLLTFLFSNNRPQRCVFLFPFQRIRTQYTLKDARPHSG